MAQLVDPNITNMLKATIFTETCPVKQYCCTQMLKAWNALSEHVNITTEHRLQLVNACCDSIYKASMVSQSG